MYEQCIKELEDLSVKFENFIVCFLTISNYIDWASLIITDMQRYNGFMLEKPRTQTIMIRSLIVLDIVHYQLALLTAR